MPLGPHSERTHDVLAALAARCRLQLHETVCEVDEPVIPAREAEDLTGACVRCCITTMFQNGAIMDSQPIGSDQLSAVFSALGDATRRAILLRLAEGDRSVAELHAPFAMSQPAISRHLKVLEAAGLISRRRRATARLSHLEAEPLREATAWLARYQAFWDERFQQLDALLTALQAPPPSPAGEPAVED